MNKILIISDIHHDTETVDEVILKSKPDKIIIGGDIFDTFNEYPTLTEKTCNWLNNLSNNENVTFIYGNHDIQYAMDHRFLRCSGYEDWKRNIINDLIPLKVWNKFKYHIVLDDIFLITHAGFSNQNMPNNINLENRELLLKSMDTYLHTEEVNGIRDLFRGIYPQIFAAGVSRGGFANAGGILWCDYNHEFQSVPNLNQIFGHTPTGNGKLKVFKNKKNITIEYDKKSNYSISKEELLNSNDSYGICIDSYMMKKYAIWNGETLSINVV